MLNNTWRAKKSRFRIWCSSCASFTHIHFWAMRFSNEHESKTVRFIVNIRVLITSAWGITLKRDAALSSFLFTPASNAIVIYHLCSFKSEKSLLRLLLTFPARNFHYYLLSKVTGIFVLVHPCNWNIKLNTKKNWTEVELCAIVTKIGLG